MYEKINHRRAFEKRRGAFFATKEQGEKQEIERAWQKTKLNYPSRSSKSSHGFDTKS